MNKPEFKWYENTHMAVCTLTDGVHQYTGTALCSEEDLDMCNQKTGYTIALMRAKIDLCKGIRDNELKPQIAILKHLYSTLSQSPFFNPDEKAAKAIRRELKNCKLALRDINATRIDTLHELQNYLVGKNEFYKHIRANRSKQDKTE